MELRELTALMTRLRDRERGCPWDLEQDFATIAPYTIEEAYEVADAIERDDMAALRDELGDLLFQVVFHAQLAREAGAFDIGAVIEGICQKMWRRHPHVFGDANVATADEQTRQWEEHKRRERGKSDSELDGVPRNLPALTRAAKLGRRAARVGFDWPDAAGALGKLDEEVAELKDAIGRGLDRRQIEAEIGDLLFCVTNVCRHLGVDPEGALRGSNAKFERRFRSVEQAVATSGRPLEAVDLVELDRLWELAKSQEQCGGGDAFSTHSSAND
jgi:MazG family protein